MRLTPAICRAVNGYDVAVFPLHPDPFAVIFRRNGFETDVYIQLVALEQQFFQEVAGCRVGALEKDSEGKVVVDIGLADVEDEGIVACQNLSQCGSYARPVGSVDI